MAEVILLALLGIVSLIYVYMNYIYNYWKRKGVPQAPAVFGFGNILDACLMRSNPGLIFDKIYRLYPEHDAVGVYLFRTPSLLVRSPELIKRVLASDFSSFHDNEFYVSKKLDPYVAMDPFCIKGEEWKPYRTKLVATMTATRVKEIFPLMKEIIPRLELYIDQYLGKDIEAKHLSTLFTMDNVSNIVFGINSNCFIDSNCAFRKLAEIQMKEQLQTWWKTIVLMYMPKVRDFMGLKFTPKVIVDYVENMVKKVYEHRSKNNVSRNDLFQYFMKKVTGYDKEEIMFYSMTFFLEGFETSSMVASTVLYELTINPGVQQTLYEELSAAFGDSCDPDYDTINNLPYMDKVLEEAQRKYPVVYLFTRECTKPTSLQVNGKSVDIEVGTPIHVPMYSLHYDPSYYPDPDVFDPERFNAEGKSSRPQYTYMPFGEGPRICPGMRFALAQIKLLIANLVFKYKLLLSEKTPKQLTLAKGSALVTPNEEKWIRIEKRM